jgi:hypothetical protein
MPTALRRFRAHDQRGDLARAPRFEGGSARSCRKRDCRAGRLGRYKSAAPCPRLDKIPRTRGPRMALEIKFGAFDAAKILDRKSANLHYFAVPLSSLGMEGQTTIGWLPPSHIALRLSSSRPIHSSSRRGAILSGSISIHRSARSSIALTRRAKPMPSIAPNR